MTTLTSTTQTGQLLTGDGSANDLRGTGGDDTLRGLAGDDSLHGGAGDDVLDGGEGVDTVYFTNSQGYITASLLTGVATGQGTDTLVGVEHLVGSKYNDWLVGDAEDNRIKGEDGADTLEGGDGNDTLEGGQGDDRLVGGAGSDWADFTGSNSVQASLLTGKASGMGWDRMEGIENLRGGSGSDTLTGDGGENMLVGDQGDDTLVGGGGNDALFGGVGSDKLHGGEGDDILFVGSGGNLGSDIVYGDVGTDSVVLVGDSQSYSVARLGSETVKLVNGSTGQEVWVDRVEFFVFDDGRWSLAELLLRATTAGPDLWTGSEGADHVNGMAGNDVLRSLEGDDTLDGGSGADILFGGLGNDVYMVDEAADLLIEQPGEGTDRVWLKLAGSGAFNMATQAAQVENAQVSASTNAVVNVVGNGLNNRLQGHSGDNKLEGGDGDDTLEGGGGNDQLLGGSGSDWADYSTLTLSWPAGVQVSLSKGTASSSRGKEKLTSIENLMGSKNNDWLTGDAQNNVIQGGRGNDTLEGGGGIDRLEGGDGDDALKGGDGNDVLSDGSGRNSIDGGAGNDVFILPGLVGGNPGGGFEDFTVARMGGTGIRLAKQFWVAEVRDVEFFQYGDEIRALDDMWGNATSMSNDNWQGTAQADNVDGLAGNDVLWGLAGNDTLIGGAGVDTLIGGANNDLYGVDVAADMVMELPGEGYDTVEVAFTAAGTFNMALNASNVENARVTSAAKLAVNVTGNDLDNWLSGHDGANKLDGGEGNDAMYGLGGNDSLTGGAGNDWLDGGAGKDTMAGGAGDDVYVLNVPDDVVNETVAGSGGVDVVRLEFAAKGRYTLPGGVENASMQSGSVVAIDVLGNALNNWIEGNEAANLIEGGAGNDQLWGYGGHDTLLGGDGDDVLYGGNGSNSFSGGNGDDVFYLNRAFPYALSAPGVHAVDGGAGFDVLVLLDIFGKYERTRLSATTTRLVNPMTMENVVVSGVERFQFADANKTLEQVWENVTSPLDDVWTGTSGADRAEGQAGNDVLWGLAGNDTLIGGAGVDTLIGGAGNDLYGVDVAADMVMELPGEGYDTVEVAFTAAGTFNMALNASNVENARVTSAAKLAVNVTGNALDNWMSGHDGANKLDGGEGNDAMYGLGGNDSLTGGAGNDWLDGGAGKDTMAGGAGDDVYVLNVPDDVVNETVAGSGGVDWVRLEFAAKGRYTLPGGVENASMQSGSVVAIDVLGNAQNNQIEGNAGANKLDGAAGDDYLAGWGGHDTLLGGTGQDSLLGGEGRDQLSGGAGADRFVLKDLAVGGWDTITDFAVGEDLLVLDPTVFVRLAEGVQPGHFRWGLAALDADDFLLYNPATGALFYDADGLGGAAGVQILLMGNKAALNSASFSMLYNIFTLT
jgi:Ca2+-binding RTX toxin-like protein